MKNRKFISVIWGYHKQIFSFEREQNYHMMPLQVMKDEGYECEIFAIDAQVKIEDDPNFIDGVKVVYYKNIFQYLYYLFQNRDSIIYSNSLTIKTLLVGMVGKKTVFYPHSYPFGSGILKRKIIIFFYRFFSKIRVNNSSEYQKIETLKKNIGYICPLSVSQNFLSKNILNRSGIVWIGNLTFIKDPEFLIKTFNILRDTHPNICLNIIGEDRYDKNGSNFQKLVDDSRLGRVIKLLGVKSHREISEILKSSKIYINTSVSEGQCLAVYEAALAGNILCLPRILSFPSVFGSNAYYHTSPQELAENIIQIYETQVGEQMVIKNQKMIKEKYNYGIIKEKLGRMFLELE